MATLATLVVKLTADTGKFKQELSGAEKFTRRVTGSLQSIGKGAIMGGLAGVTLAVGGVAAVMKSTVPLASDFQSQLTDLGIAASSSGLGFDELHDAALAVGGDTSLLGVSATGAADSMTGLYKAGLSTTEIFGDLQGYMAGTAELGGALRASIDLAAATELDMVQASDLAAVALATFGGELETEAERAEFVNSALNNMVQAADASVAEVSGLADALKNVGPTASSMGIGIEDTNNALAILSTRGIQGAEAGTALRSMLANMRRPTKQVKEALKELNVSLYDAEGNFVGLPNLIEQMEDAFAGLTNEQQEAYSQILAGPFGMNALNTLLAEGTVGWDAMAEATENAAGIQEQAAAKAATFAGKMEALDGAVETLKIRVGEAFLPVATRVVELFGQIAEEIGPVVVTFFQETLAPAIEMVTGFVESFIEALLSGQDPVTALQTALSEMGLDGVAEKVGALREGVVSLWEQVEPFVTTVVEWIGENVELEDVLIALGIAVASVVVPAVISLAAALLPIIAIGAALVAAVALVRTAWEEDWGGIQTKMTDFWENTGKPTLEALGDWLEVAIPAAIEILSGFWTNTLQPALEDVWTFIENDLFPLFEAVANFLDATFTLALEAFAGLWENVLLPILEDVWKFISEDLQPVWEALAGVFDDVSSAVQDVIDWFNKAADAVRAIELPDWLKPGSPPPLYHALMDIKEGLRAVERAGATAFDVPRMATMPAVAGVGGNVTRTTNYTMNVQTRATTPTVQQDFEMMRALGS